ncbi:MAG: class I SAM-dependent methyltransferase [Chloroflexi bacterium]|nr:class I SAM-dependent methyltransferase [Chloroflexota bacterium]
MRKLLQINREFYTRFAVSFAQTRSAARSQLQPIMPYLRDGVKVLDVGCGNGRVAERAEQHGLTLRYVGVDASAPLIEMARTRTAPLQRVSASLVVADVSACDWTDALRPYAPFDVALALGLLHHVPSFDLRARVLRAIGSLLREDGVLAMSNWQFTRSARLRGKVVPWHTLGMDERELEAGDVLMDWKRGGALAYRYVHLLTPDEMQALGAQSGFDVVEQFEAESGLNLISVMQRVEVEG